MQHTLRVVKHPFFQEYREGLFQGLVERAVAAVVGVGVSK
jgi:hypothetical protein